VSIQGITEEDIASYLVNTPAFFERHAELLASVQLKSPFGGRTVSLQERQMEMLRDKHRGLEARIVEMIRHGQENVAIADKLHRWTRAMLRTRESRNLPEVLVRELAHEFMIPQAAIRLWGLDEAYAGQPWAKDVGADARQFAASLPVPYCGANTGFDAVNWLDDAAAVASMAMLPLRDPDAPGEPCFGLLVLASPDPTRYSAGMGTEFLQRIAETAGAALARLRAKVA
jgi:uncharacterized protein YigA (DUF484 family)